MRFETQVEASVVGRSAREYAAQSGLRESSEGGEAEISAPVQVIPFRKNGVRRPSIVKGLSSEARISRFSEGLTDIRSFVSNFHLDKRARG
jgi:hypothetical protein